MRKSLINIYSLYKNIVLKIKTIFRKYRRFSNLRISFVSMLKIIISTLMKNEEFLVKQEIKWYYLILKSVIKYHSILLIRKSKICDFY